MNQLINFILIISCGISSFFITWLLAAKMIKVFNQIKLSQIERNYLAENKQKQGTATLGGIAFVFSSVVTSGLFTALSGNANQTFFTIIGLFLAFFLIGLLDDLLKISKKTTAGLPGALRLFLEFLIALICLKLAGFDYQGLWFIELDILKINIYLGILFILLALFLIVGFANAVNLTDGLDGLASGLVLICLTPFLLLSIKVDLAICFFIIALCGSLLGFLRYNFHPAKLFMGDCGALALGAVLAYIAILVKGELILFIASFWLLVETASVIIQVAYFKLTNKRILLMAPFHHHLQKRGWAEWKIVMFFWLIGFVFCLIALVVVII